MKYKNHLKYLDCDLLQFHIYYFEVILCMYYELLIYGVNKETLNFLKELLNQFLYF